MVYLYNMVLVLQKEIREQLKDAMRAKDTTRVSVLRGLLAAFTNELVAQKRPPQEELTDEEALAVIKRQAKQRKDSMEQFEQGGRPELVRAEKDELAIINTFLPAQMPRKEIEKAARAKKTELGITDKANIGKIMASLMGELKGKADGTEVKAVVESLFDK